jgi:hypothetical protein
MIGLTNPFKLATYPTTAVNSARESVVPNAGMAVPGSPRVIVVVIYA